MTDDAPQGVPLIIAVDGPAGVGKSTAARRLARRLEIPYLDTGAMYRAVALCGLDEGVDLDDGHQIELLVERVPLSLQAGELGVARVLVGGEPVEERIRTPEVSDAASRVSAVSAVRRWLVDLQRDYGRRHGAVLEGRDIGTKVFPETPHKFFLDARPEVRYRRRWEQLRKAGREVSLEQIRAEGEARDRRDSQREDSPLTQDASYTVVDTSDLSLDEVVERMVARIRAAG